MADALYESKAWGLPQGRFLPLSFLPKCMCCAGGIFHDYLCPSPDAHNSAWGLLLGVALGTPHVPIQIQSPVLSWPSLLQWDSSFCNKQCPRGFYLTVGSDVSSSKGTNRGGSSFWLELQLFNCYFLVPKKDGGLCPILDLHHLNFSLYKGKSKMLTLKLCMHRSEQGTGLLLWTWRMPFPLPGHSTAHEVHLWGKGMPKPGSSIIENCDAFGKSIYCDSPIQTRQIQHFCV